MADLATKKTHLILVNAVVEKDGKILVSQRSWKETHEPGKWTIPGGKVEKTSGDVWNIIEETLKKEVMEETGVEITDNAQLLTNNTFIGKLRAMAVSERSESNRLALVDYVGTYYLSV